MLKLINKIIDWLFSLADNTSSELSETKAIVSFGMPIMIIKVEEVESW